MAFIALAIPLLVVTAAMVVYLRFGRSAQYENYLAQAQTARIQAASLADPIMQRDAWQSVLLSVVPLRKMQLSSPPASTLP